jgi:hypothetical protein
MREETTVAGRVEVMDLAQPLPPRTPDERQWRQAHLAWSAWPEVER